MAVEFLQRFHPAGPWMLATFGPKGEVGPAATFMPGEEMRMRAFIERAQGKYNVYFSVNAVSLSREWVVEKTGEINRRGRLRKKAEKVDIEEVRYLPVDADLRKDIDWHDPEAVEAEKARVLGKLRNYSPPPTAINWSGGGYQGFWRLSEVIAVNGDKLLMLPVEDRAQRIAEFFGADSCHNADRIMRVPGTINVLGKTKIEVGRTPGLAETVEFHDDRIYDLEDFPALGPKPQAKARKARTNGAAADNDSGDYDRAEYARARSALEAIPAHLGRDDWRNIGFALKCAFGEAGYALWLYWSQSSKEKFTPGDIRYQWDSFKRRGGITIATLFKAAMKRGWVPPPTEATAKLELLGLDLMDQGLSDAEVLDRLRAVPDARVGDIPHVKKLRQRWTEAGRTPSKPRTPNDAPAAGKKESKPDEWPDPVPLPSSLPAVAPFDYALLPLNLRDWVKDIADRMQCPPDFVAVSVMAALAAVIGRKLALRPKTKDDWAVLANLWAMIIGPPGVMKSPAQNEALRPLRRLVAAALEEFKLAKAIYDVKAKVAKVEADNNEKQAAKEAAKKDANKDIIRNLLTPVRPDGEEPTLKRYVTTNTSPEALGEVLRQNENGVLVHRDELLALLEKLDEEGHTDEREMYLTGWNGDTGYTFDRIGRGLNLHIEALCISMLGGTQPARLGTYLQQIRKGGRGNDGLIQRFSLMVWPDIVPTWEDIDREPNREAANAAFEVFKCLDELDWRAIKATRDRGYGGEEEGLPYIRLSDRAHEMFVEWRTKLEHRLRSGELDPMVESHLAKYRKLVPALALIIHLADAVGISKPGDAPRGKDGLGAASVVHSIAMEQALKWAVYLETHAARIYGCGNIVATEAAHAIIVKVKSGHLLKEGFSSRDVWRPGWSKLRDRDVVTAALKLLEDYDWLRVTKTETAGRPATMYTVNPKVLSS
jgi:putative DNA primase/helicase